MAKAADSCPPWGVGAPALVVDRSIREVLAMRGGPAAVLRCMKMGISLMFFWIRSFRSFRSKN